jgi:hypothetical protein
MSSANKRLKQTKEHFVLNKKMISYYAEWAILKTKNEPTYVLCEDGSDVYPNAIPHIVRNKNDSLRVIDEVKKLNTPRDIYLYFRGYNFMKHTILVQSVYMDELLMFFTNTIEPDILHQFITAIGPFVFDVWNCTCNHGVFTFYFQNFDELHSIPKRKKDLFELWNRCNESTYRMWSSV